MSENVQKILMAGLPGSGKSTQAQKLSEHLQVDFLSMGQILRKISKENSKLGKRLKKIMDSGFLVDDVTVTEIIRAKLGQKQYQRGFILDGYPRTVDQLKIFDPGFDKVFYLKISPEEGLKRLLGRGRKDDNEEVIRKRYQGQQEKLNKLLNYFREEGILVEINGDLGVEEIFNIIKKTYE